MRYMRRWSQGTWSKPQLWRRALHAQVFRLSKSPSSVQLLARLPRCHLGVFARRQYEPNRMLHNTEQMIFNHWLQKWSFLFRCGTIKLMGSRQGLIPFLLIYYVISVGARIWFFGFTKDLIMDSLLILLAFVLFYFLFPSISSFIKHQEKNFSIWLAFTLIILFFFGLWFAGVFS